METMEIAQQLLEKLGGRGNVESAAHCATRLRLVVKDMAKVQVEAIDALPDVKGTFCTDGQFQIILGSGLVNKVYRQMMKQAELNEASSSEVKRAAMKKLNPLQRLARSMSNVFVPIIPAIVASGLMMGVLGMAKTFQWVSGDSGLFFVLDMFANTAFVFLPVLVAFSAAKEFEANPFLAAALGGIMIHPALQNAWTLGSGIEKNIEVLGLSVGMVGYQGTVLPVLLAVWGMAQIEKMLRRVVPHALDIIVTPFTTIVLSGFVTLIAIGPLARLVGSGISGTLALVYEQAGPLAGLLFGGLYSSIVITGVHHSFHAFEAELIKNVGYNFLLPIWSMANVAQGGAAMAVYFKTRNEKIRSIAIPAATSCLLGITEAAIFGVNLRLGRPFLAAAVGGAIGGAYVVLMKVAMTAVGLTGIPGISIVQPAGAVHYLIGMALAFGAAFGCSGLKKTKRGRRRNMRATYRPDGKYLWDFWLYREADAYHLFYLQAPLAFTPRERHRQSSIGHAVSHDLQSWREVECALQAGAAATDWDSVSLWTGCVVKHEQQYYLFYTARCRLDVAADGYVGHTQRIGVATSKNLYEWEKHPDNPLLAADYRYYESREQAYNSHEGWRDPCVVKDEPSGWFYMFFTARDGRRPDPKARGCIGRARSRNLLQWEVLPPAASPGLFTDMEVPSLHLHDGRWYMLFAVKAEWYSDAYRQSIAPKEPQTGVLYLTADALDAEFMMPERHPLLSGTSRAQYTGRIIEAPDGRAVFLSWNGGTDEKMAQTEDSYTLGAAVRIRYDGGLLRLDETVETSGGE